MKYAHVGVCTMTADGPYKELYDRLIRKMRYYIDIEDEEYFEMIESNSLGLDGDSYVCLKIMLSVKNDSESQYLDMVMEGDTQAQRTWIQALYDVLNDHAPTVNDFNPWFVKQLSYTLEDILEKGEYPRDLGFLVERFYE